MEVSASRIKTFKACRRAFYLKYVEELEPIQRPDALEIGSRYHELLEELETSGTLPSDVWTKESAMAHAYAKYIYPRFKVAKVEEEIRFHINADDDLVGRVDGLSADGCLVEHKTTGSEIGEDYEYNLMWDEQILAYMLATGTRKVYYTVCRKPTIRQKKGETEEEFYNRMIDWYDDDTEHKIRLLEIERTDEEVAQYERDLQEIVQEIHRCDLYYRNTCHCTKWGRRCEYAGICLNHKAGEPCTGYMHREKEEKEDGREEEIF